YHANSGCIYAFDQPNTFERMKAHDYEAHRTHNVYYPFAGREEWELAKFLQAILSILSIILSSEKQYAFVSLSLRASLPTVMLNAFTRCLMLQTLVLAIFDQSRTKYQFLEFLSGFYQSP
ncbi:hypothetical protein F4604DRAFT_1592503, partial [Suillus subluteus]